MKKNLFNLAVYTMLFWTALSATYLALPIEWQEQLPQMNWLTAVVSGGSTFLLGSGGLAVQHYLLKVKRSFGDKETLMTGVIAQVADGYKEMREAYVDLKSAVDKNSQLLKIDLNAKLSNPLIDEEVKRQIEGAINEEE